MKAKQPLIAGALLIAATYLAPATARAAVLYSNLPDLSAAQNGQCPYDVACGTQGGRPVYAAQEFSLSGPASVTSVAFNSIVLGDGATGTAANYQVLDADGAGGLPGTLVASGLGEPLSVVDGPTGSLFSTKDYSFNVTPLSLTAGSYYIAIQEISANPSDYLSKGVATSGAAESIDGGAYTAGYDTLPSIAVSLQGTEGSAPVPEPASFALLGIGFIGLLALRRPRVRYALRAIG